MIFLSYAVCDFFKLSQISKEFSNTLIEINSYISGLVQLKFMLFKGKLHISLLFYIYYLKYIYSFLYVKATLHLIKPTWLCWIRFLMYYCWIWFANILSGTFASKFIQDIDLKFSFSCCVSARFWGQDNAGLIEWVREKCYSSIFLE